MTHCETTWSWQRERTPWAIQRLHMRRSLTAVLVKLNVLLFTTRYISYLKHEL